MMSYTQNNSIGNSAKGKWRPKLLRLKGGMADEMGQTAGEHKAPPPSVRMGSAEDPAPGLPPTPHLRRPSQDDRLMPAERGLDRITSPRTAAMEAAGLASPRRSPPRFVRLDRAVVEAPLPAPAAEVAVPAGAPSPEPQRPARQFRPTRANKHYNLVGASLAEATARARGEADALREKRREMEEKYEPPQMAERRASERIGGLTQEERQAILPGLESADRPAPAAPVVPPMAAGAAPVVPPGQVAGGPVLSPAGPGAPEAPHQQGEQSHAPAAGPHEPQRLRPAAVSGPRASYAAHHQVLGRYRVATKPVRVPYLLSATVAGAMIALPYGVSQRRTWPMIGAATCYYIGRKAAIRALRDATLDVLDGRGALNAVCRQFIGRPLSFLCRIGARAVEQITQYVNPIPFYSTVAIWLLELGEQWFFDREPLVVPAVNRRDVIAWGQEIVTHPDSVVGNVAWASTFSYLTGVLGATQVITGVVVNEGYYVSTSSLDRRPPHCRTSLLSDVDNTLMIGTAYGIEQPNAVKIIYSPDIVGHVATRLGSSAISDLRKSVQSLASRDANINIMSEVYAECITGTAIVADFDLKRQINTRVAAAESSEEEKKVWNPTLATGSGLLCAAAVVLPWLLRESYPHIATAIEVLDGWFTAPLREEVLKEYLYASGMKHPSTMFGLLEFGLRIKNHPLTMARHPTLVLGAAQALALHCYIEGQDMERRLATHIAYNRFCAYWVYALGIDVTVPLPAQSRWAACASAALGMLLDLLAFLWGRPSKEKIPARMRCTGYRVHEVPLPKIRYEGVVSLKIFPNYREPVPKSVMQVSLGCSIVGLAPPIPDTNHGPTVLHGSLYRFARPKLPIKEDVWARVDAVMDWLELQTDPILPGHIMDYDEWEASTSYSLQRKKEIRDAMDATGWTLTPTDYQCEGHGKKETYPVYKPARGINARKDRFKATVGPAVKTIEYETYALPYFVKHVPVKDRPAYLTEAFFGCPGPFRVTDYSSFESSFSREVMDHIECRYYRHKLKNYPHIAKLLCDTIMGVNTINFKWFQIKIEATRMSGEMCTSLGNGITNLVMAMASCKGDFRKLKIVVEGDDGLMYHPDGFNDQVFKDAGFSIKILEVPDLLQSSFCGLMMAPDLASTTEPRKVLLNFGWTHSPLMMGRDVIRQGLLRAKAMSLLYEHPRCPILSVLARTVIEYTAKINPVYDENWYERQLQEEAASFLPWAIDEHRKGISDDTRLFFEHAYDVPVSQQLEIEEYIRGNGCQHLDHDAIYRLFSDEQIAIYRHFYDNNVKDITA